MSDHDPIRHGYVPPVCDDPPSLLDAITNLTCHKHGMGECYPTQQREKHVACVTGFVLANPDLVLRALNRPCPHSMVRLDCDGCLIGALLRLWKNDS